MFFNLLLTRFWLLRAYWRTWWIMRSVASCVQFMFCFFRLCFFFVLFRFLFFFLMWKCQRISCENETKFFSFVSNTLIQADDSLSLYVQRDGFLCQLAPSIAGALRDAVCSCMVSGVNSGNITPPPLPPSPPHGLKCHQSLHWNLYRFPTYLVD